MQKTSRLNRLLAVLVAVFMAVCCLPLNAFAEGNINTLTFIKKYGGNEVPAANFTNVEFEDGLIANNPAYAPYFEPPTDDYVFENYTVSYSNGVRDPWTVENGGSLVQGCNIVVTINFKEKDVTPEPDPEPEIPDTYTFTVKFCAEDGTQLADDRQFSVTEGASVYNAHSGSWPVVEGYTFDHFSLWEIDNPLGSEAVATSSYDGATLYAVYTKDPEPTPATYTFTVKFCAEDGTVLADDRQFSVTEGASVYNAHSGSWPVVEGYTFDHFSLWEIDNPLGSEAVATSSYDGATLYAVYTKDPEPTPATYTFTVKFCAEDGTVLADDRQFSVTDGASVYNAHSGSWPVVEGYTFDHFSLWEIDNPLGSEAVATSSYDGATLYAVYTKDAVESEKDYITYKIIDAETREQIATWQVLEGDPLSAYSGTVPQKEGYTLDYLTFLDGNKPVDLANTVAVKNLNGGLEWTLEAHFKVLPAGYKDVCVRFEFVDLDGNTVLPALNYATCLSDDVIGPKVKDVLADATAKLAEGDYAIHHMTLVYEDGSESSALQDPVVVTDYDGRTIKVYCNKVQSGNGGSTGSSDNNSSNNSNNSNNNTTTTATSTSSKEVVKASAPADNTVKILPQTGISVETPVVFGGMLFAALAGAGAYLFVMRKKLNQTF